MDDSITSRQAARKVINDRFRAKKKAESKCTWCANPAVPERTLCAECAHKQYLRGRKKVDHYTRNSRCVVCGKPSAKPTCRSCRCKILRGRENLAFRRRSEGQCGVCGQVAEVRDRQNRCENCRIKYNEKTLARRAKRNESGVCVACAKHPPVIGKLVCVECRIRNARYRQKQRDIVIDGYGAICVCCGENNRLFLTLDHVNGRGAAERRQLGGQEAVYKRAKDLNFPDCYQLLCFNCNCAKGSYTICPHKWDEADLEKYCGEYSNLRISAARRASRR